MLIPIICMYYLEIPFEFRSIHVKIDGIDLPSNYTAEEYTLNIYQSTTIRELKAMVNELIMNFFLYSLCLFSFTVSTFMWILNGESVFLCQRSSRS